MNEPEHVHVFLSAQMSKSRAPRAECTADTRVRILGFGGGGGGGGEEKAGHSTGQPNIHRSESVKRV